MLRRKKSANIPDKTFAAKEAPYLPGIYIHSHVNVALSSGFVPDSE